MKNRTILFGARRPAGRGIGLLATALAVIGAATSAPAQVTFNYSATSIGGEDGYLTSQPSGTASDSTNTGIRVGLTSAGAFIRGFLSFDTALIPSNASITAASLKIVRGGTTNPPSTSLPIFMELQTGAFSGAAGLAAADLIAAATVANAGNVALGAADGVSTTNPISPASAVNKQGGPNAGRTQIRIRLTTDPANTGLSKLYGFYAGETATIANRPQLLATYNDPNLNPTVPTVAWGVGDGATAFNVTLDNSVSAPGSYSISAVAVTGADAGEFGVTSGNTGALAAGGQHVIALSWDPAATGLRAASLVVTTNRGSFTLPLDATGVNSTATPTETPSATASETPSATPTETPSATASETPSATATATPLDSPTASVTPTISLTPPASPTESPTPPPNPAKDWANYE